MVRTTAKEWIAMLALTYVALGGARKTGSSHLSWPFVVLFVLALAVIVATALARRGRK